MPEAARPPVLITDCDHPGVEEERAVLGEAGLELRLEHCVTAADVIAAARDSEALINQYAPIDASVCEALAGRCRIVARYGVGVDNVDVEAATRAGIWVANVPDYGTEEVADHALALIYALLRAVGRLDRAVRAGGWDVSAVAPLRRVSTLTLGLVGRGRIGTELARKAAGVGLRVVAYDPLGGQDGDPARVSLEQLLASADVVSIHAPLTSETHHLFDRARIASMRPGAYLVNTSRGGLVDVVAVLEALESGRLAGAALDVLEHEPPGAAEQALIAHDRVIVTPHAAWYSEQSAATLKSEAAREVVRVLRGERPRSPVNELQGGRRP